MNKLHSVSFICHFEGNETRHRQNLTADEIGKWIDAYKFTHPRCKSISIKIWFEGGPTNADD